MITIDEIKNEILIYNPKADLAQLDRAYEFSARAHAGQMRKSGEPYLIHPLEVAKILTQLRMDTSTVIAGILHDTIEDTEVSRKDIEKAFSLDIAEIVDGVTKISKIQFSSKADLQAENYRKMIIAMSKDIRVIMVKLADRLNNMRTLQFMSEAKQASISEETIDIYVPIASRMGIQWLKEELENLALSFIKPEVYRQIESVVKTLEKTRADFMWKLKKQLMDHLGPSISHLEISGRIKQIYSIYRKMVKQEVGIDEIHDLIAFRVLVPSMENCYEALGVVHSLWKPVPGRFKDYMAMPKANNYQSLHTTVVCSGGERVEFQIRTFEMHEVAEKGIAAHWKYKEDGRLDTRDEAKFRWLRQLVDWQKELKDSIEFVDTMKVDLFSDEIFVFTPKGEVKNLPKDATPLDFAFAIHSDLGKHCSGCKVNGRIAPLSHRLESGDVIEIVTSKQQLPHKDWLDFVVSSRAKNHIRGFIRNEQRGKSLRIGKSLFEVECRKHGVSPSKLIGSSQVKDFLEKNKIAGTDELYSAMAYGKITADDLLPLFADKNVEAGSESVIGKIFRKVGLKRREVIQVEGVDDVLVTFGKCCTPVPGDKIIGFVTRGRGVTVHRLECPRVLSVEPERRVETTWNVRDKDTHSTRVLIVAEDRKGMLADITRVISEKDISISKVLVKIAANRVASISMDISVRNLEELLRVIKALENVRDIIRVEREIGA